MRHAVADRPVPPSLNPAESVFSAVTSELEALSPTLSAYAVVNLLHGVQEWLERRDGTSSGPRGRSPRVVAPGHLDRIPELEQALVTLHQLLEAPDDAEDIAAGIARACRAVSLWAEKRGARQTAMACAQAASDAQPRDGWASYRVARLARVYGRPQDALRWWGWSAGQGRRVGDVELFTLSLCARGSACAEEGDTASAMVLLRGARRAAAAAGLRVAEAEARYELAMVRFALGLEVQAHADVLRAVEAYGPGHSRLPDLARDVAYLWLEFGEHEAAAQLCGVILECVGDPGKRLLPLAYQARAAAALGWTRVFESAWINVWSTLGSLPSTADEAFALVQLAFAAATAGSWMRASVVAEVALEAARRGGYGSVVATAERIIEAARTGAVPDDLAIRIGGGIPGVPATPSALRAQDSGTRVVLDRLSAGLRGRDRAGGPAAEPAPSRGTFTTDQRP